MLGYIPGNVANPNGICEIIGDLEVRGFTKTQNARFEIVDVSKVVLHEQFDINLSSSSNVTISGSFDDHLVSGTDTGVLKFSPTLTSGTSGTYVVLIVIEDNLGQDHWIKVEGTVTSATQTGKASLKVWTPGYAIRQDFIIEGEEEEEMEAEMEMDAEPAGDEASMEEKEAVESIVQAVVDAISAETGVDIEVEGDAEVEGEAEVGDIVPVRITGAMAYDLTGMIME